MATRAIAAASRLELAAVALKSAASASSCSRAVLAGINGTGTGSVALNPPGVSGATDCSQRYVAHTVVTLTPTAGPSSRFTGWGGIDQSDPAASRRQQVDPVSNVLTDVTGAATGFVATGVSSVDGSGPVFSVNVATGAFTAISTQTSFINNLGMAYDLVFDKFWVVDFEGRFRERVLTRRSCSDRRSSYLPHGRALRSNRISPPSCRRSIVLYPG